MWKLLDRSLRFWILFWLMYCSAILLAAFQEATFYFYGPVSSVLGIHLHRVGANSAWQYSILYLLVPAAWAIAWCSRFFKVKFFIFVALIILILVLRFLIDQSVNIQTGGAKSWTYHVGPGNAWYGNMQNKILLSIIADPIHYMKIVVLTISSIAWIAVFNSTGIKLRRLDECLFLLSVRLTRDHRQRVSRVR